MIKTSTKTHPLTHRLPRLTESDVKKLLEPKKLLIRIDEIIFK